MTLARLLSGGRQRVLAGVVKPAKLNARYLASAASSSSSYPAPPASASQIADSEWQQRCALAVAYRVAHVEGWDQQIFNHITLKVEGSEQEEDGPHFLINEFGMSFDEVTASSLIKLTVDGEPVGEDARPVFKPGFVIHSAVHGARHDCKAVWHCHELDATAVCQTRDGLLPISQEALYTLNKGVGYHPCEFRLLWSLRVRAATVHC